MLLEFRPVETVPVLQLLVWRDVDVVAWDVCQEVKPGMRATKNRMGHPGSAWASGREGGRAEARWPTQTDTLQQCSMEHVPETGESGDLGETDFVGEVIGVAVVLDTWV